MPPRRKRTAVVEDEVEEPAGSGQSAETLAQDLARQPALLEAAAQLLAARHGAPSSSPATSTASSVGGSSKKKAKASAKALLNELMGGLATGGTTDARSTSASTSSAKKKACNAAVRLAKHMQGPKRGQYSGKVFYTILCAFDENEALYNFIKRVFHQQPRWFKDWGAHVVECPSDKLALKLHRAILDAKRELPATLASLNTELDVSAYDNAAVTKHAFTLAESELQFETRNGVLPRSILITPTAGSVYPFKEFMKDRFKDIRYTDLVFNGGAVTKAGWVLPVASQTEETGTLAAFLGSLGVNVTEVDLDEDDEEDDEAPRDDTALVDAEAEEGEGDDE